MIPASYGEFLPIVGSCPCSASFFLALNVAPAPFDSSVGSARADGLTQCRKYNARCGWQYVPRISRNCYELRGINEYGRFYGRVYAKSNCRFGR